MTVISGLVALTAGMKLAVLTIIEADIPCAVIRGIIHINLNPVKKEILPLALHRSIHCFGCSRLRKLEQRLRKLEQRVQPIEADQHLHYSDCKNPVEGCSNNQGR